MDNVIGYKSFNMTILNKKYIEI